VSVHWLRALAALVVLAIGLWLVTATEWVDVEVPTAARGEAARNERYVAQSLLRKLGATVVQRPTMEALPPVSARLVLDAWDETGLPDRARRLHDWVAQGGQLAIPASIVASQSLTPWLPVELATWEASADWAQPAKPVKLDLERHCRSVAEADAQPATYAPDRRFQLCTWSASYYRPQAKAVASWSVVDPKGIKLLRVPLGRGSVTVFDNDLLNNDALLRGDHALLMVAALQARPGAEVWFLRGEGRASFSLWLWRKGWPAAGLAALALLLIWWRAAPRFGPRIAFSALPRRSMREQVRGTAAFLRQRGPASLHAAQRRALDECVAQRLRLPSTWDDNQRATAIAQATGIDAQALARALPLAPVKTVKPAKPRGPAALAIDLQVLESARRRLLSGFAIATSPATASFPSSSSSSSSS